MDFIAILDYEHLDNSMFLQAFARSLARKKKRGIVLHGDSEYTERIIQTGVMRKEATIRAIKELNRRLAAFFADKGVSTIAVNGFQKSLIRFNGQQIIIEKKQLLDMPVQPVLLISNLCEDAQSGMPIPVPLPKLVQAFSKEFDSPEIDLFSIQDSTDLLPDNLPRLIDLDQCSEEFKEVHIPNSFRNEKCIIRLNSPTTF